MCRPENDLHTDAATREEIASSRGCLYELGVDYGVLAGLRNCTANGQQLVGLFRREWNDAPAMNRAFYDVKKILTRYHIVNPGDTCTDEELEHQFAEYSMAGHDMITSFLRSCTGQKKGPFDIFYGRNELEVVYAQLGIYNLFGEQNAEWVRDTQRNLLRAQFQQMLPEAGITFSNEEANDYAGKGLFLNADTLVLIRNRRGFGDRLPRYYLFVSDESEHTGIVFMDIQTEEDVYQQMAAICNHTRMQSLFRNAAVRTDRYDGIDMKNIEQFSRDKSLNKCMQAASYGYSFFQFLHEKHALSSSATGENIASVTFCGMTNVDYATINLKNPQEADLVPFAGFYRNLGNVQWDQKMKNQGNALLPKMKKAFVKQKKEGDWDVFCTSLTGTESDRPGEGQYRITDASVRQNHTKHVLEVLGDPSVKEVSLLAAPGIGKTYSVRQYIRQKGKGIFVYISPRIAINQEVILSVEKDYGDNGISLTTDSRMNNGSICAGSNVTVIQKGQKAAGKDKNGNPYHLRTTEESEKEKDAYQSPYNIEARTSSSGVIKENRDRERVLDRLCGCAGNIAAYQLDLCRDGKEPELPNIMIGLSTQACGKISQSALISDMLQIFGIPDLVSAVTDRTGKQMISEDDAEIFRKTFGNVTFMVDEISGDEGGSQILRALRKICTGTAKYSNQRIAPKLIVADASMQDKTTASRYLGADTSETVFINRSGHHSDCLYTEPDGSDKAIINCCTYPAKNLFLTYKTNIQEQDYAPAQEQDLKPYVRKILDDVISVCRPQDGQTEQIICQDGSTRHPQCLVYIQNKDDLANIKRGLEEWNDGNGRGIRCMELTSNTDAHDKAAMQDTVNGDNAPEVLLITSSGARGLSFKYVTHLFIQIPTFSICSNMMEIMQTIYRGRGDQKTDSECSRYITFYLDLTYTKLIQKGLSEDEKEELRKIKMVIRRQKRVDMMSVCLLMQGCVESRILGYDRTTGYSITPLGRQGRIFSSPESVTELDKNIQNLIHYQKTADNEEQATLAGKVVDAAKAQNGDQYKLQPGSEDYPNFMQKWKRYMKNSLEQKGYLEPITPFVILDGCIIFRDKVENILRMNDSCRLTDEEKRRIRQMIHDKSIRDKYRRALKNVMEFISKSEAVFDRGHDLTAESGHTYYLAIPISSLGKTWSQSRWSYIYREQQMDIINCMATSLRQFTNIDVCLPLTAEYGFENVPFLFFFSADFEKKLEKRFVNTELVASTSINLLSLILGSQT